MKDNLFEMLLNLFETSLTQLQESEQSVQEEATALVNVEDSNGEEEVVYLKPQQLNSIRVVTTDEQVKLTKASYQFLIRMKLWNVVDENAFELIIHQLQFSDSRIVTLEETKWTIRTVLAAHLSEEQLSFLDMVLYQAEDELTLH